MARIPMVDPDDPATDPEAAAILRGVREQFGDNNFYLAVANNPDILNGIIAFGRGAYFGRHIDPRLTELAYLTASVVNRCHY